MGQSSKNNQLSFNTSWHLGRHLHSKHMSEKALQHKPNEVLLSLPSAFGFAAILGPAEPRPHRGHGRARHPTGASRGRATPRQQKQPRCCTSTKPRAPLHRGAGSTSGYFRLRQSHTQNKSCTEAQYILIIHVYFRRK